MKKINLEELKKMNFEYGEKTLMSLGYYCSGSGETESNISDYAVDTYYTLEDEDGNEIDIISFSQFLNGRDGEEQESEVSKEKWSRI